MPASPVLLNMLISINATLKEEVNGITSVKTLFRVWVNNGLKDQGSILQALASAFKRASNCFYAILGSTEPHLFNWRGGMRKIVCI